jgi:hypothetical protein
VRNPLLSDMAAAGNCFGVWILGFHWRSRVPWGPMCAPSHIDLLLEEAISGASRPAFIPGARYLDRGTTRWNSRAPARQGPSPARHTPSALRNLHCPPASWRAGARKR